MPPFTKKDKPLGHGYRWKGYLNKATDKPLYMYEIRYNLPTQRYTSIEHWGSNSLVQATIETEKRLPIEAEILAIEYVGSYDAVMKQLTKDYS